MKKFRLALFLIPPFLLFIYLISLSYNKLYIIKEEKMGSILSYLYFINSFNEEDVDFTNDNINKTLNIHHVTPSQFKASILYYSKRLHKLKTIYKIILDDLLIFKALNKKIATEY